MEARKNQLKKISDFIEDVDRKTDQLLAGFGWNRTELNKKNPHSAKKEQADPDPDAFPESFYEEHHSFSVKIDKETRANLLRDMPVERDTPTKHEDLLVDFSPVERLALYQYVLDNTPAIKPLEEIQISFKKQNKDAKMTSLADIAAYRRNVFRRNQKYRVAKNPLTYQEEVRNLIQMQTDAMAEYLGQVKTKEKSHREEKGDQDKRKRDKRDRERTSRERSSHRKRSRYD